MCTKLDVPMSAVKLVESGVLATTKLFSTLLGWRYLYSPLVLPEDGLLTIFIVLICVPEPLAGVIFVFLKVSPITEIPALILKGKISW